MKLDRLDFLLLTILFLLTSLYTLIYLHFSFKYPFEDAAILMRYAQNLGSGHGMVWNVGEAPVDGATDFLLVVVLAGFVRIGFPLEPSTRLISFTAHLLTIAVVYLAVRRLHKLNRWLALTAAAYLAAGPALGQIAAFFGTPFFGFFAAVSWYLAHKIVESKTPTKLESLSFALSSLILGLIRPEGVLLAGFMLLAIIYLKGWQFSKRVVWYVLTIFGVLGGAYFFWRWQYFGYLLPNPYYIKGQGSLHGLGLILSTGNVLAFSLPLIPVFILAILTRKLSRQTVFTLIPILGFTSLWVLISPETNFLMRFQYALLPVIAISWPPLFSEVWQRYKPANLPRLRLLALAAPLIVIIYSGTFWWLYQYLQGGRVLAYQDGRRNVAEALSEYSKQGYTLATTDAGLLPLYSRWQTVDLLGLNDQWIAHNGLSKNYLDQRQPEVIMFPLPYTPLVPLRSDFKYFATITTLKQYVEENNYILAAAFGETPYFTHHYFVRAGFADSEAIIKKIRSLDYFWYRTNRRAINYAQLL